MRAPETGWGGLREAVVSQGENVTRCIQGFVRAQGQEDTEGLCSHPAGQTWREDLATGASPRIIPWGHEAVLSMLGSELIMVTRQVLTVVGGLAAHEHVPVAQDLIFAQTAILVQVTLVQQVVGLH